MEKHQKSANDVFEEPRVEIILFGAEDVIATSDVEMPLVPYDPENEW